jgi:acetyl esterase/lipase
MKLGMLDPELRRRVLLLPPLPVHLDWGRRVLRALIGLRRQGKPVEGVVVTRLDHGPGSRQSLRLYTPAGGGSGAALLWIHGGGFVIGDVSQDEAFCAETARELGVVVASAEYRLAPEHPFPSALDDVLAAWRWLQRSADSLGADPARVAIGGQSAGAGLAACLVQRLHDSDDAGGNGGAVVQPIAQWLFSPMLDDRTAGRRELDRLRHRVWHNVNNRVGWGAYLGAEPGAPQAPDYAVAARRADLRGLPPTWLGVGDVDLFADEGRDYSRRLREAGVDCTFELVPGAPHGFENWAPDTRISRDYLARSRSWLGARLTDSPLPIPADR